MTEVLLKNELVELEDSHITTRSFSRVLRHRAPDGWSKQDEEEVLSVGSNEALGRLQEMVAERPHLLISFLECLRVMEYNLESINKQLPVERCVLWIVPSPFFAARVVHCCAQSKSFKSDRNPFFWLSEQSSVLSSNIQFLYRYCALFGDCRTELILIYPQEYTQESLTVAITGALAKWQKCALLVYSTLGWGTNLLDTIIVNDSTGFKQGLLDNLNQSQNPVWLNSIMHNHKKQRLLLHQMVWLGKLVIDVEQFDTNGSKSQFLEDLNWDTSLPPTAAHNESLLMANLSYFKDDLLKFIRSTRLWAKDQSSCFGMSPIASLKHAITNYSLTMPAQLSPLKLNCQSTKDINSIDLDWFTGAVSRACPVPVITCCAINQLYPNLTTPTLTEIACDNCCHLAIQCILYMNNLIIIN